MMDPRGARLFLPHGIWTVILAHFDSARPYEAVGLLAANTMSRRSVVSAFYPGRNTDRSSTRYTMDPEEVQAAISQMERRGERLLAIAHSHPRTAPVPSAGDLVEATLPGILSVIVSLEPRIEVRAWKLMFNAKETATAACEIPVEILGGGSSSFVAPVKCPIG